MAQFKCPQCHADVTKDKDDELGCPCCGYAVEGSTAPYFPFQLQPVVIPSYPQQYPWWFVGDPVPNPWWYVGGPSPVTSPDPIITWGEGTADVTIKTSDTVKVTANEDGSYTDYAGNKFQVSYTSGHAQA